MVTDATACHMFKRRVNLLLRNVKCFLYLGLIVALRRDRKKCNNNNVDNNPGDVKQSGCLHPPLSLLPHLCDISTIYLNTF